MLMENSDKEILKHEISQSIVNAVYDWCKKNDVDGSVRIEANVEKPTCYIDEIGNIHHGGVIMVNCELLDEEEDDY